MSFRTSSFVSLTVAAALAASAASAQSPADTAEGLEEIVVTAQKRAENLQDTPLAITAITGASIEQYGRDDVAALAFSSPSLAYSEAGGEAQLYIRGVGTNIFGVGADPSVAINLDGVYLGRAEHGPHAVPRRRARRSAARAAGHPLRPQRHGWRTEHRLAHADRRVRRLCNAGLRQLQQARIEGGSLRPLERQLVLPLRSARLEGRRLHEGHRPARLEQARRQRSAGAARHPALEATTP
jgi:hypothetical protein